MANLKIKDGDRNFKFIKATGDGTVNSPHITENKTEITALPPLPVGQNLIGKVDVVTLPTVTFSEGATIEITGELPAGNNNIGNVDVVSLPPLPAGTNAIGTVTVANPVDSVGITGALPAGNNNIGNVDVASLPPLPAGTNAIGTVTVANPVDSVEITGELPAGNNNIGNVDVASLPPLPAGTNAIGTVTVANPVDSVGITGALPAGTNNIGDVDIASLPPLPAGTNAIGTVTVANPVDTVGITGALPAGNNNIGDVDIASFPTSFINGDRLKVETQEITITGGDATAANQTLQLTELEGINNKIPVQASGNLPVLARSNKLRWRDDFNGSALAPAEWSSAIASGQSVVVNNSEFAVNLGTTANAESVFTALRTFRLPCRIFIIYRLSQRIVNQEIYFEIVDSAANDRAGFQLDSTSATTAKTLATNNNIGIGPVNLNTPSSATYGVLEMDVRGTEIVFSSRTVDGVAARTNVVQRNRQIPNPALDYNLRIRTRNLATAPASATTLTIDAIVVEEVEEITTEISTSRPATSLANAVGVQILGSSTLATTISGGVTATVSGTTTSADLLSTTTETAVGLGANATYTGAARNTGGTRNTLRVLAAADQAGTIFIDQSINGTTWFQTFTSAVAANVTFLAEQKLYLSFYRIRYTNGATLQGSFSLFSTLLNIGA